MEYGSVDPEDISEELTGKRKSRMKSLKSRLFGKKRKEEVDRKLSQSASNIEGDVLECEGELLSSQGTLGSRALSHDSIFVPDLGSPAPEPPRVLSQENVHSTIKALQEKLQLQNMRLGPPPRGPPPLLVPIKRQEDVGGSSEDDGLPHSPSETCQGGPAPRGGSYKAFTQSSSRPLSPIAKPSPTHSTPLHSAPQSGVSPVPSSVDFSCPAQFTPCLDNSAARHRMSVKPRNQRASAKTRRLITNETRQRSESFNTFEHPMSAREEGIVVAKEMTRLRSFSTQVFGAGGTGVTTSTDPPGSPLITPEFTPLRSAPLEVLRSSSPTLHLSPRGSPQKHTLSGVSSPGPGTPEPSQKPVQPLTGQQPQPLFAQSKPDLQGWKEGAGSVPSVQASAAHSEGLKASAPSGSDRPSAGLSAVEALKTSLRRGSQEVSSPGEAGDSASPASVSQEDVGRQPEQGLTAGLRRVAPGPGVGSGSFKFSITSSRMDQGRSRTGSLLGVMEPAGAGLKKEDRERGTDTRGKPSNLIGQEQRGRNQEERGQLPDPGPGDKSTIETPKQGVDPKPGAPPQNAATPLDRKAILRKEPFESPSPQVVDMDTGLMEGEEACQEGVEEAMEAKEEEVGKAAFGVKLRSTSLSLKYRSEGRAAEDPEPKKPVSNNTAKTTGATLNTRSGSFRQPGPAASDNPASSLKGVHITSSAASPASEGLSQVSGPQEAQSFPASGPQEAQSSPASGPQEAQPSPASGPQEAQPSPASGPQEAQPSPASGPQEAQPSPASPHPDGPPTPQPAAPEVSWMSFAMEKTRNLQQLFTSRLPKEFPGMQQSAPQPQGKTQSQSQAQNQAQNQTQSQAQNQAQSQAQNQAQSQTQNQSQVQVRAQPQPQGQTQVFSQAKTQTTTQSHTEKETQPQGNASQPPITKQLPAEIRTAAELSATSQQQTGRLAQSPGLIHPQTPGQLKAATQTTKQPDAAKLPESVTPTAKQTAHPVTPQTSGQFSSRVSQTSQQPNLRTTQPLLRSLPQTRGESISQTSPWPPLSSSPKSTPSQAPWSSRGLHSSPQTKATTPAQVSTAAPSLAPAPASPSALASAPGSGRVEGPGSLQRRGNGTTETDRRVVRTGTLGQRTAAFQEPSSDSAPPAKVELRRIALESTATSKTVPGVQTRPESSPTRVTGRLTEREDTCLRKNTSCSPSSSPSSSSPLQNISNSGQPSWMELAKRKSMAWSDKTMD